MFKLLKDAFKVKDIRSRIFFTVLILFVFRLGTHITVPGVDASRLREIADLPFLNMLNLVSGGAMQQFSIFSMGVSPYITASIVIQLLQMDIVPRFVEWSKQGEVGRKKLNQATRYLTLVLAFVQSMTLTAGFNYYTTWLCQQSKYLDVCGDWFDLNSRYDARYLVRRTNHRTRNWKWCVNDYLCRDHFTLTC